MLDAVRKFFGNTTDAGRCLVGIALSWPFFVLLWVCFASIAYLPGGMPGTRPEVFSLLAHLTEAAVLVNTLVALWLWPRRHQTTPRLPSQFVSGLTIAVLYAVYQLTLGTLTTGMNMTTVGLLGIGLLLFDKRVVLVGFALTVALLLLTDLFVLAGKMPYAPALIQEIIQNDEPTGWWLFGRNVLFYVSFAAWVLIIFWLLRRMDEQNAELEVLSRTDGLTQLSNRRHFMERLQTEIQRRDRYQQPFAVVLCDADHFKQVNDTYGHHAGDEVLCHLGRLLATSLRIPGDLAARIGGEEFALVLPDCGKDEVRALCERIRSCLAEHDFVIDGRHFRVTVSMGAVECGTGSADDVLRQADINLYEAKYAGRNRVVVSALSAPVVAVGVTA